MKQSLSDVPETLLIPLWARAIETKREDPIIKDEKAIEMMQKIDYDFSKFYGSWMSQTGVAVRTQIFDAEVTKFINEHPYANIINIGCGLDTRYFRVDNGTINWYDIDLPEPIRLRKNFFTETSRHKMIGKSVFDFSWIDYIDDITKDTLFITEGILMYFSENDIHVLMNKMSEKFTGATILFDIMAPFYIKNSKKHDTVSKTGAVFKWGIKTGKEMEQINSDIRFLKEWSIFDFHKNRWKFIRWLYLIPYLKNNFNCRIIKITV
ncbi:class I SAM-dependent methyltransferase [Clostridiaceae bacterium M8S5]|nr:class I SAM-dependent methyltransferase [Clostridiaceae bacterium M8S5]